MSSEGADALRMVRDLRDRVYRLEKLVEQLEDISEASEFRHAVGHVLTCPNGTRLCIDCEKMLRRAMRTRERR